MDLQMENQSIKGNQATLGSPLWRSNMLSNNILYFILVSWISKWRTNCFRGTKKLQFCIMDLQMENELLQGNQAAIGSPCWRSNCLVNDVSYILFLYHGSPNGDPTVSGEQRSFNFVSWISIWGTNCFRGTKKLQFCIMDLQIENQLLQGNQAALGSPCWRSNTLVNDILYFILASWIQYYSE